MHATLPELWESEKFQTAKVTFKVIQGIGIGTTISYEHSIATTSRFDNSEIWSVISRNLKRSCTHPIRDVIYHMCTSTCQFNLCSKCEVPSFNYSKGMIWLPKYRIGHMPLTHSFQG